MSVIVGLGNPGSDYRNSRHNVGFMVLEQVASEAGIRFRKPLLRSYTSCRLKAGGRDHLLVRPLTFMNRSGLIFPQLLKKSRAELADVVVVCDNMDLECGRIRLRRGGSHAGHNGIKSIMSHTGGADFLRIYVGIGRPAPWVSVVDHVLGAPEGQESEDMKQGVFRAAAALSRLLEGEDEQKVMNEFNRTGPS